MIAVALFAAAASQPAETPRQFIARTYAQYRHQGFSPLAKPERYFSPQLTAAIRKDGSTGEVGYLDGDPLCDCQDYEKLSAAIAALKMRGNRSADARVQVTLGPRERRNLDLRLVLTGTGWRIADVIGDDRHSLLRELQRANSKR